MPRYAPYSTIRRDSVHLRRQETATRATLTSLNKWLLKKSFSLYTVSPLDGFDNNERRCRSFARRLSSYLRNHVGDVKMRVEVEAIKDIRLRRDDPEALRIVVQTSRGDEDLYLGWFLCFGSDPTFSRHINSWLPVLLCHGKMSLRNKVHNFIRQEFSCTISEKRLSSLDLGWVGAAWSGDSNDSRPYQSTFYYLNTRTKLSMKLQVSSDTLKKIWISIHTDGASLFTEEEKVKFYQILSDHINRAIGQSLSVWRLSGISLPGLVLADTGKIKMLTAESAAKVLIFVTELCQQSSAIAVTAR